MRRALAIVLLGVLGLPLFASAFGPGHRAQLPVCCRREGAHHCQEMAVTASASTRLTVRAVCPAFPHSAAPAQSSVWSNSAVPASEARLDTRPAPIGQVEAGYRIASARSRHKRGPPARNS